MAGLIETLGNFLVLADGALGLKAPVFVGAADSPALAAALLIAFLSGVSEMIGQSVVLVINRVPLYRFLASLAFTGVIYLVAALTWATSVVLIAPLFGADIVSVIGYGGLFAIIAMSYAPRLFGVLTIAPYFGVALGYALDAWVLACVIYGLHAANDLPFRAAAICGLAGWTAGFVIRSLVGHFLRGPLTALRRAVSGSALEMSPQELTAAVAEAIRSHEAKR